MMKPTYQQLETRIAELERKVRELEARPAIHTHHHYHAPVVPTWGQPLYQPYMPFRNGEITCNIGGGSSN